MKPASQNIKLWERDFQLHHKPGEINVILNVLCRKGQRLPKRTSQMMWSVVEEAPLLTGMLFIHYIVSKVSTCVMLHSTGIQRKQFGQRNHPELQLQTFSN